MLIYMNGKMIGDVLREGRLNKQLQLTDIENETGIAVQHLLALELDQFALIPVNEVESYLRSYAASVGLDADEILDQYNKQSSFQNTLSQSRVTKLPAIEKSTSAASKEDVPLERMAHRRRRSHREQTKKKSVLPKLLLSLLGLSVIALAGFLVIKYWPLTDLVKKSTSETTMTTEETTTSTVTETTTLTTEIPLTTLKMEVQSDGSYLATLETDKSAVDVTFTLKEGESWVSMNDGVNGEQGMLLSTGQNTFTVAVNKGTSQLVTVGQPQLTTVSVDGQELELSEIINNLPATFTLRVE